MNTITEKQKYFLLNTMKMPYSHVRNLTKQTAWFHINKYLKENNPDTAPPTQKQREFIEFIEKELNVKFFNSCEYQETKADAAAFISLHKPKLPQRTYPNTGITVVRGTLSADSDEDYYDLPPGFWPVED